MRLIRANSKKLEKIYDRSLFRSRRAEEKVKQIIEDVRSTGDEALLKYTKKFDKVKLSQRQLKVSQIEISGAYQSITPNFVSSLKVIIENINKFYGKCVRKPWRMKDEDGVVLGENFAPLDRIGIYIPAGTAPLVSTVYMTVLPAKIAGVKKIALVSPPDKEGNINPHILVVADLLKVDEIYRVGGAQAIAALAFGTKTIPKVDKIVGPGNIYVSEAKRQVFGYTDIDMIAGPTELVIISSRTAEPKFIVSDLKAQSEHYKGLAILITNSRSLAKEIKNQTEDVDGFIILAKHLKQAAEITNKIAPEHLEIMVNNPKRLLKMIKHAGAIFLGPYSPTAVGDYAAGPSHVLPTHGTARFFSGLSASDFIKANHIISYSKKALEKIREPLEKIAAIEGLSKHLDSVKARF
ncbi:MAG: histidinol dehydrogenase [Candidatus Omnitrophica bacterium]|nr:histidinol dehydrogenase [Candidatus Omnitrophota bacterium]